MRSKKVRRDRETGGLAQGTILSAGTRELCMRNLSISLLAIAVASSISAQQQGNSNHVDAGPTTFNDSPNLSVARLGRDDLIGITGYDAPELTRTVRVDADGNIRLPM